MAAADEHASSGTAGSGAGARREVSRRAVLGGSAALAAGLAATATASPAAASPAAATPVPGAPRTAAPPTAATGGAVPDHRRPGSFVSVHNGQFTLAGRPFRFGGTNTYYLHQQSHYMIDAALDDAVAMSLRVVRAWAFADGPTTVKPLQPEPFVYNEDNFDSLDYAVWKAGQLGLKLVLTLANNWPDYGGMRQYVSWFLNLPDDTFGDAVNHDRFYVDPNIRRCYRAYAAHVIGRRNRYTGLAYRDDPTIMTFELANEPRNRSDKTGATVLAWAREMSAFVKRLAPKQLVAVGDEGFYGDPTNFDYPYSTFEGDRWLEFVKLPAVDYATFHLYPQGWGETSANKPGTDPVEWGATWITTHLADAARLGKPAVLEEYGLAIDPARDIPDAAARQAGYARWTAEVERAGSGDQFWLLTSRVDDGSFYPDFDGYRIYWANDAANPSNATAQMLSAHAQRMAAG